MRINLAKPDDRMGILEGNSVSRGFVQGPQSCLVDGVSWVLLAWMLHLPPSAVPLVGDVRFRRSAQRLARLT